MTVVYVGYDEREHDAYAVCKKSLLSLNENVKVEPLHHRELRQMGVFDRPWKILEDGSYEDVRDEKPFSTQFSHSRFLTPLLAALEHPEEEYAVFVDADFVFLQDVEDLVEGIRDYSKNTGHRPAVWCVKHDFTPTETKKMDGMKQEQYSCKLWSSLMVFDLCYFRGTNPPYVVKDVNTKPGIWFHSFQWLPSSSKDVGALYEGWNFVPEHSAERVPNENIFAIHYTRGVPTMEDVEVTEQDDFYFDVLDSLSLEDMIFIR